MGLGESEQRLGVAPVLVLSSEGLRELFLARLLCALLVTRQRRAPLARRRLLPRVAVPQPANSGLTLRNTNRF
jgi:hypothetical protein